jgi:hypothetical protein
MFLVSFRSWICLASSLAISAGDNFEVASQDLIADARSDIYVAAAARAACAASSCPVNLEARCLSACASTHGRSSSFA